MKRGIPISFFSSSGGYIGGYSGTSYINVKRQRLQAGFNNTTTSFEVAKKIIYAKITNQVTVLRRYNRTNDSVAEVNLNNINHYKKHIVIYDISDDKRRRQYMKLLNSFGYRIQESAYEAYLSPPKYNKLKKCLKNLENSQDSVILYKLNALCDKISFGNISYQENYMYDENVYI